MTFRYHGLYNTSRRKNCPRTFLKLVPSNWLFVYHLYSLRDRENTITKISYAPKGAVKLNGWKR